MFSLRHQDLDEVSFPFFRRKTRGEPSAQTSEEEEGKERDMRRLRMQETSYPVYATPSSTGIWNDGHR